jgi:hypothetical protein
VSDMYSVRMLEGATQDLQRLAQVGVLRLRA